MLAIGARMRAFVAIEIPPVSTQSESGSQAPTHLTLLFLGEVASGRIEPICNRLAEVAQRHSPFELRLEGIGSFPSSHAPRVVWIGTTIGRGEVERLAADVRLALRGDANVRHEETFVPHVTLFRVRSAAERKAAEDVLAGRSAVPPPRTTRIEEFVLKESSLGPGRVVHRTLASFRLKGGEPAIGGSADPARLSTSFFQR